MNDETTRLENLRRMREAQRESGLKPSDIADKLDCKPKEVFEVLHGLQKTGDLVDRVFALLCPGPAPIAPPMAPPAPAPGPQVQVETTPETVVEKAPVAPEPTAAPKRKCYPSVKRQDLQAIGARIREVVKLDGRNYAQLGVACGVVMSSVSMAIGGYTYYDPTRNKLCDLLALDHQGFPLPVVATPAAEPQTGAPEPAPAVPVETALMPVAPMVTFSPVQKAGAADRLLAEASVYETLAVAARDLAYAEALVEDARAGWTDALRRARQVGVVRAVENNQDEHRA